MSWEFCAHGHEEYVPRRALLSQAAELAFLRAKLQGEVRTAEDLQAHCNALAAVTKQLALNLEQPTVNDLGFTKRYVRCLQVGLKLGFEIWGFCFANFDIIKACLKGGGWNKVVGFERPAVNDLGFTKRYVRCLQVRISI